jgi:hypothetical protein
MLSVGEVGELSKYCDTILSVGEVKGLIKHCDAVCGVGRNLGSKIIKQ